MIDLFKAALVNQFEAALCMLDECVESCPEADWHAPVANLKFSQAAFHVLLFTDLYLGRDVVALRRQPFHQEHAAIFADYEELENRPQEAMYDKSFITTYVQFCREKARHAVAAETAESLVRRPGFEWFDHPRAEVYLLIIRHLQHHAAQLSLHLRLRSGQGVRWVGSAWRNG